MASSLSECSRGAKRRTVLPSRTRAGRSQDAENEAGTSSANRAAEDGLDSGLSSESSTPTNGSPQPRQRKAMSSAINIVNPAQFSRLRSYAERIDGDKTSKIWRNRSATESPRSLDSTRNRQFSSPLRTSRNIQSPSLDSGDEASLRIDRDTYQYMTQDIVSIKTMLLKLKRVLQEAETLNPFENSMKNGLFYNLNEGGTADVGTSPGSGGSSVADELADLRRQVIFLQGQVEDRDRTIQVLQFQMSKLQGPNGGDAQNCGMSAKNNNTTSTDTCNAATQTEKTRPVSAGPSLLQALPQDGVMGPLVSWSDSWDRQRSPLLAEPNPGRGPRKERAGRQQASSSHRQNGQAEKGQQDCSPGSRRACSRSKEQPARGAESGELEQREARIEGGNPIKSFIPTPRKLATPTLIPRKARAVSATGRAHNA
ncbi:hypothetical protein KM043_014652 [Ampulex compressa]|nr:hypothetical protein KM043_014652 [Ampulex compressa]